MQISIVLTNYIKDNEMIIDELLSIKE